MGGGKETGVVRKAWLNPSAPTGLPSSFTAHIPAGTVRLGQQSSKCGPQTAAPAGVTPGELAGNAKSQAPMETCRMRNE